MHNTLEQIKRRRLTLKSAADRLKADFIGLDEVVDQIISKIEYWYIMPELCRRPTIVCLWGMTGVGKTDLVRKLVSYLDFSDSFVEIQMTNKGYSTEYSSPTISGIIEEADVQSGQPNIFLFDEMQRYRTVSECGDDIEGLKYEDIWQLLSDGQLPSLVTKKSLQLMLYDDYGFMYGDPEIDSEGNLVRHEDEEEKGKKFGTNVQTAIKLKKRLKLSSPLDEIIRWDFKKREEVLKSALNNSYIFKPMDFRQSLIFISGNLDEAFSFASQVSNTDTDADEVHEYTKKINFLNIKKSLTRRFKPEQIARFGNTHIIYPSLSRRAYEGLISKHLSALTSEIKERHNLLIEFDKSINDFIYKNGVIPSQGVRPLFSTLSASVDSIVPKVIISAHEAGIDRVLLRCDHSTVYIQNFNGDVIKEDHFEGEIDKIKRGHSLNRKSLVSVHEAGHALVYACLFGVCPKEIVASTASDSSAGFVSLHSTFNSSPLDYKKMISVFLGGYAAEKIVFGIAGEGSQSDISKATDFAFSYYRTLGFGGRPINMGSPNDCGSESTIPLWWGGKNESKASLIERLIDDSLEIAASILKANHKALICLSEKLIENERISKEEFVTILDEFGIKVRELESSENIEFNYHDAFKKYIEITSKAT